MDIFERSVREMEISQDIKETLIEMYKKEDLVTLKKTLRNLYYNNVFEGMTNLMFFSYVAGLIDGNIAEGKGKN